MHRASVPAPTQANVHLTCNKGGGVEVVCFPWDHIHEAGPGWMMSLNGQNTIIRQGAQEMARVVLIKVVTLIVAA